MMYRNAVHDNSNISIMAIRFVKKKRTIRFGSDPGVKYCAVLFRGEDITFKRLAEEVNNATTVNKADAMATLIALEEIIKSHILDGSAVKLGTLGSFIPKLESKAEVSADKVSADSVKRVSCRFYPSAEFYTALRSAEVQEKDIATNIVH